MNYKISPDDKTIIELAATTYDDYQLNEIVTFSGSMDDLNCYYPIECLRKVNNVYRACYLGDGLVAVIVFDNAGNKIIGEIHKMLLSEEALYSLEQCKTLRQIQQIDPNGDYSFLYTGRNDTPRVSSHYSTNGIMLTIEYDNENRAVAFSESLI